MAGVSHQKLFIGSQVCLRLEELHPKGRMEIPNGEVTQIQEDGIHIHIPVVDSKYLEGRRVEILWEKGVSLYCLSSTITKCIQKENTQIVVDQSDRIRWIDKRRYFRLHRPIHIEFRTSGENGNNKDLFKGAEGKDVSGGGIRFLTKYHLRKGQKLEMLLEVPIFPYLDTSATGEIVRVDPLKDKEGYQIGVHFLEIEQVGLKRLVKFILDEQQPLNDEREEKKNLRLWFALC